uniref:CYP5681A1 protein n=1 Tax=Euplotes crassus TaxID=5936 RepID=A0A1S5RRT4_EUPCR|nr:CYP5681A1 protein [Moneuplotes crassus]
MIFSDILTQGYLGNAFCYFLLILAGLVVHILNTVLLQPYLFWRKYKKYPNVITRESFSPILGDMKEHIDSMRENKVHYAYMKNGAEKYNKHDLRVTLDGIFPTVMVLSNKALEEFLSMQVTKIDRDDLNSGVSGLIPHSLVTMPSTKEVMRRRKNMLSWVSLNSASKYIPRMLRCLERVSNDMKTKKQVDLVHSMNVVTFDVFSDILFGDDVKELVSKLYPYDNPDGSTEMIELREMLIRLTKCHISHFFHPSSHMFKFLKRRGLVNPFKRDAKNAAEFKRAILELVKNSKEQKAAHHMFSDPLSNEVQKLDEVCGVMLAGPETTSHSLVSCLYFLNKNPETLKKLREELNANGFKKGKSFYEICTMEKIQSMTYLTCCVKEAFRCDIVAPRSFSYAALEDIEICDVPISKGTKIRIDLSTCHFDKNKWPDEYEFIPERHDFESEYYQKAKQTGIKPDVYSRRTFSHGMRSCPGQSFAMLEMKVAIAYLVTHLDIQFDEEQLNNKDIGFGLGSHFIPLVTVKEH